MEKVCASAWSISSSVLSLFNLSLLSIIHSLISETQASIFELLLKPELLWSLFALWVNMYVRDGFYHIRLLHHENQISDNSYYYSTNYNTIQIWSWWSRYPSSVGNRYPAIDVASYVGRKSEVKKCRQKYLKMLRAVLLSICWIIKQLSCSISRNIVWF